MALTTFKKRQFSEQAVALVALIMPFYRELFIPAVGFAALVFLFFYPKQEWLINFRARAKYWILLLLPFLMALCATIWTENNDRTIADVSVKAGFLFFPVFLSGFNFHSLWKHLRKAWLWGCGLALLSCFILATYRVFDGAPIQTFNYSNFSVFHHPVYFALMLNLGICMLIQNTNECNKWWCLLIITLFTIGNVFLSAKVGLISNLGLLGIFLIVKMPKVFGWALTSLFLVGIAGIISYAIISNALPVRRFANFIDKMQQVDKDIPPRFRAWECAKLIIAESPVFGTGGGDVIPELVQCYEDKGYTEQAEIKLNAHNWYYQTTAGYGYLGMGIWAAFMLAALLFAWRGIGIWLSLFWVIFLIQGFTESLLELHIGCVITSFWGITLIWRGIEHAEN